MPWLYFYLKVTEFILIIKEIPIKIYRIYGKETHPKGGSVSNVGTMLRVFSRRFYFTI